jgi:hypothetical protein
MKRFKSCLLASAGLVILAATLSLTAPGRAFAQRVGEDCVRICDTAASPLHVIVRGVTRVTGDVTINNQSAIATTVTGPVQVTTSPREPLYVIQRRKVDNIFQEQVSLTLMPGENIATKDFLVPADKFLEIKNASGAVTVKMQGDGSHGYLVSLKVLQTNNSSINLYAHGQFQGTSHVNNQTLTSYHIGFNTSGLFGTPTDTVQVRVERLFADPSAEIKLELAITGEYHDF